MAANVRHDRRSTYYAFAFLDPLLAGAAHVVEGDDIHRLPAQVGDDEADAGIKFAGAPLNFGDDARRFLPMSLTSSSSTPSRNGARTTAEAARLPMAQKNHIRVARGSAGLAVKSGLDCSF